jgi:DNA polymerase I-like protein with 3'-5' exonuclease and polymerase domains
MVLDLETSVKNRGEFSIGKLAASSYHPDNKIVLYGYRESTPTSDTGCLITGDRVDFDKQMDKFGKEIGGLLVGQNIKFDLLYLLRDHYDSTMQWLQNGGRIYDTQLAEYILTGQEEKMIPLGNRYKVDKDGNKEMTRQGLAEFYGGTDKDDRIKEFWDQGFDTEDIPIKMLTEYLIGDVDNTRLVYKQQSTDVKHAGKWKILESSMDALLATTLMEFNGMYFDLDTAIEQVIPLEKEQQGHLDHLKYIMWEVLKEDVPTLRVEEVNPNSNQQISTFLYGGTWTREEDVAKLDDEGNPMVYKTGLRAGEIKTRKEKAQYPVQTTIDIEEKSVDDETLTKKVRTHLPTFTDILLRYRGLTKDINTYYAGLTKLTWPTDSCIHGSINHCVTNTGRLSSSAPNLQNITN